MRDSRITLITAQPVTVSSDATAFGATLDLKDGYVGDHWYGTGPYGLPVEFMVSTVVTGTGDGFTLVVGWQDSEDGSNWDYNAECGTITFDTDGNILKKDGTTKLNLTRGKVSMRLRTARRYARLYWTSAGITGGETVNVQAWVSDGTKAFNDGVIY